MRGRGHLRRALLLALAAAAALLLAGSARPVLARDTGRAAGPVTITKSTPPTVTAGWFDYTITLTYVDTLTGVSPEYTVTDALPADLIFIGLSISGGTCTTPQPGQNGTVTCTTQFAPASKTTTIKITVEAKQVGTLTNTAQLSTGETASATTTVTPPPPGTFAVTQSGPSTVTIPLDAAPERFGYTIDIAYAGPPLTSQVRTRFTDFLPALVTNPGLSQGTEGGISDCKFPPQNMSGATVSCDVAFDPTHLAAHLFLTVRPTGETGTATNRFSLDTGDSADWTTAFVAAQPPPVPGPPAAPTQTVTETFSQPGQAEPEAVAISPTAETAQVVATWSDPSAALDLTNFQLVQGGKVVAKGRVLAAAGRLKPGRLKPGRLKITKKRRATSVEARVTNLKRGKLRFKVVAKRVSEKTKVRVVVRQSKKRVR